MAVASLSPNYGRIFPVELQNHNQMLTNESASLKQRLQHFDKMRELTEMLQESHR